MFRFWEEKWVKQIWIKMLGRLHGQVRRGLCENYEFVIVSKRDNKQQQHFRIDSFIFKKSRPNYCEKLKLNGKIALQNNSSLSSAQTA